MYVKKANDRDHYKIIITDKEIKEAFKNPVSYKLFKQTLEAQYMAIIKALKEADNGS